MFEKLAKAQRFLMEIDLEPLQGDRFQPTGFADLGAGVYERPDGMRMLLVESVQSMANRLEHGCLNGDGPGIARQLDGLPYVLVRLSGDSDAQTSSLIEAHRLNSPYIMGNEAFKRDFVKSAGYARGKPLDWSRIAKTIFRYDLNSLIHGVFLANLEDGRIKVPRALSAFIEAEDIREAPSGGVKNNRMDSGGRIRVETIPENVYGNVPYHRMEYTARRMTAYFNMDLSLLAGYGLELPSSDLLVALGLYKIRRFLSGGLRLRTACDLAVNEQRVVAPEGFKLPGEDELLAAVARGIKACSRKGLFAKPPVTVLKTDVKITVGKDGGGETDGGEETP